MSIAFGVDDLTTPSFTSSSITTMSNKTLQTTTMADAADLILSTGTGTKIGTATNQKLAFWNKAPVVQPVNNADTSGLTLANLEIEVNQLKQLLRDVGLMAAS